MKKKITLTLTVLIFLFVGTDGHEGHSVEIWFTPAISLTTSSPDYLDLFTHPELWPKSRRKIDVFQMASWQVWRDCSHMVNTPPERRPWGNNLIMVDAYNKLKAWKMRLSLGADAIKPHHDCTAEWGAQNIVGDINFLQNLGVQVDFIAIDESLVAAMDPKGRCHLSFEEAVERIAWWIQYVKTLYPNIKIGSIEAYPYFRAAYSPLVDPNEHPPSLQRWMTTLDRTLKQRGLKLDFFQLDVDMNYAKRLEITDEEWQWEFQQVAKSARKRGIAFGMIINGNLGNCSNSCQCVSIAADWLARVHYRLDGYLDQLSFQSWDDNGFPVNLPESEICTHTGLIKNMGMTDNSSDESSKRPGSRE